MHPVGAPSLLGREAHCRGMRIGNRSAGEVGQEVGSREYRENEPFTELFCSVEVIWVLKNFFVGTLFLEPMSKDVSGEVIVYFFRGNQPAIFRADRARFAEFEISRRRFENAHLHIKKLAYRINNLNCNLWVVALDWDSSCFWRKFAVHGEEFITCLFFFAGYVFFGSHGKSQDEGNEWYGYVHSHFYHSPRDFFFYLFELFSR